jgi:hypothetical protein
VPDLLYVPVGVDVQRAEVPMRELLHAERVRLRMGEVESVDMDAQVVHTDVGDAPFDVLVAAPGAEPVAAGGMRLQTPSDAELLRDRVDDVFECAASDGERCTIVLRAEADDAWAPPAYQLAILLAMRRRMLGVDHLVSVLLATAELQPFQWFDPRVADIVVEALATWDVELVTGVSPPLLAEMHGDLAIDFPRQAPRNLPGLPGRGEGGWYDIGADGRVHACAFVVGDAVRHGFKSAFAAAWEARRVLVALGGAPQSLGVAIGGVPVGSVEHHVDLGTRTLRIRLPVAGCLRDPWLGHDASMVLDDGPPDHLVGLLVGEALERHGGRTAARAHRALVNRPGSPRLPAVPARTASGPTP